MASEQGHTPTPWHVSLPDETLVLGPNREVVATSLQDEDDYERNYDRRAADAALIVRAVNCHDDLVEACRLLLQAIDDPADRDSAVALERELRNIETARAILAKAQS